MQKFPRRLAAILLGLAMAGPLIGCDNTPVPKHDGKPVQLTDEEVKAIAKGDAEAADEEQGKKIIQPTRKAGGKKPGRSAGRGDD